MKARETFSAFFLTLGLGSIIYALMIYLELARPEGAYYNARPAEDIAAWLLVGGGGLFTAGVFMLLLTYLMRRMGRTYRHTPVTVIALFAIHRRTGEMVSEPADIALSELSFYVLLRLPGGVQEEYKCAYTLFHQLREGMRGEALCRGDQFLSFRSLS